MADKDHKLENDSSENDLKQENVNKNILEKKKFELEIWKMRIETISNLKEKEIHKKNEQRILMKNHYNYFLKKRIENCDYVQNLMENCWLINLEDNLKDITLTTVNRNEKNIAFICIRLHNELKHLKSIVQLTNLKTRQDQNLKQLKNTLKHSQNAVAIWNQYISKVEKALLN